MSGPSRRVCHHFLKGRCRFGERCRFSHDTTSLDTQHVSTSERSQAEDLAQDSFHRWRRSRPQPGTSGKRAWITTASTLLGHNIDIVQEVVRHLASEDGLYIIRSVVQSVASADQPLQRQYLDTALTPLFGILSHPQIVDSAVLEQEVGIIYRCLLGVNFDRLLLLFTFIFDVAEAANLGAASSTDDDLLEFLSVSAGVLGKLVDSSITAQLDQTFHRVAERFTTVLEGIPSSSASFHCLQARKHLTYVQRRLGISRDVPGKSTVCPVEASDRARFTLAQDMPGALSQYGPRHDNDSDDITKISLIPTVDEIMSLREEYLPTTDTALHHLEGSRGLLDRHFRLLREDLFYDLRNVVRSEVERLMGIKPSRRPEDHRTKTRTYQFTRGADLKFTSRQGLELEVQILQPTFAQHDHKEQRSAVWKEGQRLNPGSLVCAVDEMGAAAFFLVSPSTKINVPPQKLSNSTGVDENDDSATKAPEGSLAGDPQYAHLWLEPVEKSREAVVEAIAWFKSLAGPFRRQLLEFPGILIASALPPLAALQKMFTEDNLPFEDILLGQGRAADLLKPPLYTTRPGFSFDLSSLCKDEAQLRFETSDEPDAERLSQLSNLDETQAMAILNSLRRSVAITQGPLAQAKATPARHLSKRCSPTKQMRN